MRNFLILFLGLVMFSCNKEPADIVTNYVYKYHYQINNCHDEFTITYSDSLGYPTTITKTHTDCSLVYKCTTTIGDKFINVNTKQQDAEIILWICKNDTIVATAHGFTNVTLKTII